MKLSRATALRVAAALAALVAFRAPAALAQPGTIERTATGGIFHSNVRSPLGLYTYDGNLVVLPDGRWGLADYPIVINVDSGSAAARAGVMLQDVILAVNGHDARTGNAAFRLPPGEPRRWVIRVRRGGEEKELVLELPVPTQASSPSP